MVKHCFILKPKITLIRFYSLPSYVPLVAIRCITRCHMLSLSVTNNDSLYHSLLLVVIRCHLLYHSLWLDVPLVSLFTNVHLNKANKGQNTRNISSPPTERNNRLSDRKWLIVWRFCQNRENYKTNSFFFFYQRSWKINNCYQQCIGYFRFTWIQ